MSTLSEVRAEKHVENNAIDTKYGKALVWRLEVKEGLLQEAKERIETATEMGFYDLVKSNASQAKKLQDEINCLKNEIQAISQLRQHDVTIWWMDDNGNPKSTRQIVWSNDPDSAFGVVKERVRGFKSFSKLVGGDCVQK